MCETSALAKKRTHKEANRIHYTCIPDRRVPPRAQASLPTVLQLVGGRVLTRRSLPSNTRFGPVQGVGREVTAEEAAVLARAASDQHRPLFLLTDPVRRTAVHLDLSDESNSNWLHYVGTAQPGEANLQLQQWGSELYAVAPHPLKPRTVLSLPSSSYSSIASLLGPDDNKLCAESGGVAEHTDADCMAWDEGWRCHECGHLCHTSAQLQRHMLMQHAQEESASYEPEKRVRRRRKNLSCVHCSRVFTRLFCLKRHLKIHQRKMFQNSLPLAVNENQVYDDTDWSQEGVELNVRENHSLISNKIISNNLSPIDCMQDFTHSDPAPDLNQFSNGTLRTTDCMSQRVGGEKRGRMVCVLCASVARTRRGHHQHTQSHKQSDGYFYCPHCNKTYGSYVSVLKHIRCKHAPPRYVCLHCKLTFTQSSACVSHLLTHTDMKQFVCECGKAFKRKQKLKEHMTRKHPNGYERTDVPVKQIDLTGMPFVCRLCPIGFKRRGILVNHLARCHPEQSSSSVPELARPITRVARDYPCTHCTRIYRSQNKRKKHFLVHHPGEPLPTSVSAWTRPRAPLTWQPQHCPAPSCHRQYTTRSRLNRHIRDAHPDLVPAVPVQEQLVEPVVTNPEPDPGPTELPVYTEEPRVYTEETRVYTEEPRVYTEEPPVYTEREPPVYTEVVAPTAATILFLAADQHALLCQQGEETVTLSLEMLQTTDAAGADAYAAEALTYLQIPPPPYQAPCGTPTSTAYISSTDDATLRSVGISKFHQLRKYNAQLTTESSADT